MKDQRLLWRLKTEIVLGGAATSTQDIILGHRASKVRLYPPWIHSWAPTNLRLILNHEKGGEVCSSLHVRPCLTRSILNFRLAHCIMIDYFPGYDCTHNPSCPHYPFPSSNDSTIGPYPIKVYSLAPSGLPLPLFMRKIYRIWEWMPNELILAPDISNLRE
jgi:hypothetical protein